MTCFNNPDVETTVQEALKAANVAVYCGYILAEWQLADTADDEHGEVTSVSFTSNDAPLTLDCVVSHVFTSVLSFNPLTPTVTIWVQL